MILGYTGSRHGATPRQMWAVRHLTVALGVTEGHEGDCLGFDAQVHAMLSELLPPGKIHVHPPKLMGCRACRVAPGNVVHRPLDFLARNRNIVQRTGLLVAAPSSSERPRDLRGQGTWWTVAYAEDLGSPVVVVRPDGVVDLAGVCGGRGAVDEALAILSSRARGAACP